MLLKSTIEELTELDIENLRKSRGNTRESNHPYGNEDFMDMLLSGSNMLNQEFAKSNEYKINLGDAE